MMFYVKNDVLSAPTSEKILGINMEMQQIICHMLWPAQLHPMIHSYWLLRGCTEADQGFTN
jgi:hypothetical protein